MTYITALIALSLYSLGWATLWQRRQQSSRNSLVLSLILLGLLAHGFTTHAHIFSHDQAQLSLIYVVNVVTLVVTTVAAVLSIRLPIDRLFILIVPLNILALIGSMLLSPGHTASEPLSTTLTVHILISLAAYSALLMAACQSVLLAILDRQLKSPQQKVTPWLPPLETMEHLLVAMLWIGITLLTLAITTGFFFLEDMFEQRVSHHIVITSLSWLVYAFFLAGRYLFGWRGLTAVRWTLVAFTLLVIGYLGSKFVLEYILQT